jgi:hypothetical protein
VKLRIVVQSAAWLFLSYDGAERKDGKQRSVPMGCKCEGAPSRGDVG